MSKNVNVIEVTPRKILGYVLLGIAIILFFYVILSGVLLATGTIHAITIYDSYQYGVFADIGLQLGIYAILAGVAFGIGKLAVDLVKS
ncbi:MAG TPA: hypothetical protein VK536_09850 [Candidatus Limnocylindrales bacterium]|nr:hypothetical protein [Candidatus Limnocylindrales bacterium]